MKQDPKEQTDSVAARGPEGRVVWSRPHPSSVYQLAVDAMEQADDKILATAFRKLAKAEANGLDGLIVTTDVIDWLEQVKGNIDWLVHHIEHHLDLQADIPAFVAEARRKECEWCGSWFMPERSTARFCKNACRQASYRSAQGGLSASTARRYARR